MKNHILIAFGLIGLIGLMGVNSAARAEPAATELPPAALVAKAVASHPSVRAAGAGIAVEEANRDQLEAGPHEFVLRLDGQRRRDIPLDRRYGEKGAAIERGLRLPWKSRTDSELGAAGVSQAQIALADARHELSRQLLRSWYDWLRAQATAAEWSKQTEILQRQAEVAQKRLKAGDIARLEALLVEAQLNQAEAQRAEAENRQALAASELQQQFPALPLPSQVEAAVPQPVDEPLSVWRERLLPHNHELNLAREASRRQRLMAEKSSADRLPDPTLGLRWGSERDGQERTVGLTLAIPLPGQTRAAASRAAMAEADVSSLREAQVQNRVESEIRRQVGEAQARHTQWQRLVAVAERMQTNADLLEKAWRLGEGQLGDLLNARRQAIDARLAATQARLDANESRARLLLDSHQLWDFDAGTQEN